MDKLTYSTDTTARVPGANLSVNNEGMAATGNPSSGFFGGGSPGPKSTMDKIDFSSETTAQVPGASLSGTRYYLGATSAREDAITFDEPPTATPSSSTTQSGSLPNTGYFAGGNGSPLSSVDKLNYSTEVMARVPGADLPTGSDGQGATSSSSAAYFGGGSEPADVSIVDKLTYSSDTTARIPGANLSQARRFPRASTSPSAGYFGGGQSPAYSIVDKLTFSNDTTVRVPGANLSQTRHDHAATGNATAGYFGGGYNNNGLTSVDKLTYASDTTARIPSADLPVKTELHSACGNNTHGYFCGGTQRQPSIVKVSTVNKLTYSTDTITASPGLPSVNKGNADMTGSGVVGYIGGGFPGVSSTDKVNYTTDTTETLPSSANCSVDRRDHCAASSRDDGAGFVSNIL